MTVRYFTQRPQTTLTGFEWNGSNAAEFQSFLDENMGAGSYVVTDNLDGTVTVTASGFSATFNSGDLVGSFAGSLSAFGWASLKDYQEIENPNTVKYDVRS